MELVSEDIAEDTSSRSEREFKVAIETNTKLVFQKARPEWLRNPETQERMELDMYDEQRRVAIEYDGIQHYEYEGYPSRRNSAVPESISQVYQGI